MRSRKEPSDGDVCLGSWVIWLFDPGMASCAGWSFGSLDVTRYPREQRFTVAVLWAAAVLIAGAIVGHLVAPSADIVWLVLGVFGVLALPQLLIGVYRERRERRSRREERDREGR